MKKNINECKEIISNIGKKYYEKDMPYEIYFTYYNYDKDHSYEFRIDRGGMSGGNCWGDAAESYDGYIGSYDSDECIYDVLTEIDETMPFLVVKKLIEECKTVKTDTDYEYYGNCTNKETITYDIDKMLKILVEKDIIVHN